MRNEDFLYLLQTRKKVKELIISANSDLKRKVVTFVTGDLLVYKQSFSWLEAEYNCKDFSEIFIDHVGKVILIGDCKIKSKGLIKNLSDALS